MNNEEKISKEEIREFLELIVQQTRSEGSYGGIREVCLWFIDLAIGNNHADEDILEDFMEEVHCKESLSVWAKTSMLDFKVGTEDRNMLDTLKSICDLIIIETVVYLMRNPLLDIYKIGISKDVQHRLNTLTNACGVQLELITTYIPSCTASDMETRLHQHFRGNRLKGEWFKGIDEDMFDTACKDLDR